MATNSQFLRTIIPALALVAPLFLFSANSQAQSTTCRAGSTCVISGGETSLDKEYARQEKEQWDDTRSLRKKVNKRAEKEFDKLEKAIDDQDSCLKSPNIYAYWEPNTERCLDSNTGRQINP